MATNKTADLLELDVTGLLDALSEAKKEHFNLRFQHVTGQLDNTSRLGEVRRQIARISTILRQREIAAAEAVANAKTEMK
jgi:large subunit ribosomal protein L29